MEVRLVAIQSAYFSHYPYTPFHFSRTLPLNRYLINNTDDIVIFLGLKVFHAHNQKPVSNVYRNHG